MSTRGSGRLERGQYDAIVLAEAGLSRLGIRIPGERLPPEKFVPSPNQGTIAVVSRADPSLMELLSALDHPADPRPMWRSSGR